MRGHHGAGQGLSLIHISALQFFLLSLKDHKDAWQRYLKLVRRAGLASYTELCETCLLYTSSRRKKESFRRGR